MLSAMMLVRSVDQEDPSVLLKTRIGFGLYILVTALIYLVLHLRIMARNDRTKIQVTVPAPAFGPGSDAPPTVRETTHLEYDLDVLRTGRQGWLMNVLLLSAFHYKMQTVSPLIMSALMGFFRLISDDALFKLHILGHPAVDKLKRPFPAEENPLAAMLKGMMPKPEEDGTTKGEDSDQDDDDDDDGETPKGIVELTDDHVKGDFEDEDSEVKKHK